jgi:hypothetical protein
MSGKATGLPAALQNYNHGQQILKFEKQIHRNEAGQGALLRIPFEMIKRRKKCKQSYQPNAMDHQSNHPASQSKSNQALRSHHR